MSVCCMALLNNLDMNLHLIENISIPSEVGWWTDSWVISVVNSWIFLMFQDIHQRVVRLIMGKPCVHKAALLHKQEFPKYNFLFFLLFWHLCCFGRMGFFQITDLIFMFVLLSQIALSSGPNLHLHKSLLTSEALLLLWVYKIAQMLLIY